jgi:hypothetical protein
MILVVSPDRPTCRPTWLVSEGRQAELARNLVKRGMDYQNLVAAIESAFDPGADVRVSEWVEGPDGERECDVSVRGARQGIPYFALAECKDWKKRVGIGVVDALDSKRRDLKADLAAIYSNSGFAAPAVQKASRVNISTFTAVATGDSRSRARGNTLVYGRGVRVVDLKEQVIEPTGQDLPVPEGLGVEDLRFEGQPVYNWVVAQTEMLITEHSNRLEQSAQLTALYQFDRVLTLDVKGNPYPIIGIQVVVDIAVEWRAKVLEIEVEFGRFDAQTGLLWVPPNVPMTFLGIDDIDWEPIEAPTPEEKQTGDTISFRAYLLAQPTKATGGIPDLSAYVTDVKLTISSTSTAGHVA